MVNPYTENRKENTILREFAEDVYSEELVWHQDRRDRIVIPLVCDGWMFQRDNEPPVEMVPNEAFEIKAMEYHRIIKGSGKLVLKIIEG